MPFTEQTMEVKKYNECILCDALGVSCDGPNLAAIDIPRFCEWCKLLRDRRGYTNARVAEISGVSPTTVERVMAGRSPGLNSDTMSDIACALIYGQTRNGSWSKNPCAMVAAGMKNKTDFQSALAEIEDLKQQHAALRAHHEEKAAEAQRKIDHLKDQIAHHVTQCAQKDKMLNDRHNYLRLKDRYIRIFLTTSGLSIAANIGLLVWIIAALL